MGKFKKDFTAEDKEAYKEKLKNETKELTDKLEAGVESILNSDQYIEYLKFVSKFHNYSWTNNILIMLQNPEATLLAGYRTWQTKFNRQVKKGEKGIRIFAPAPIKVQRERETINENGENVTELVEGKVMKFKPTTVFDVSQTEGDPIPEGITINELTGEVENYEQIFEAIKKTAPCNVYFREKAEESKGAYYHTDKCIKLNPGMSQLQTIKTLVHETAHALLHDRDKGSLVEDVETEKISRSQREVEAESVAYIVANHFNLDTSDYSFGYVASWGSDIKLFKVALARIQKTACHIIEGIEKSLSDEKDEAVTDTAA